MARHRKTSPNPLRGLFLLAIVIAGIVVLAKVVL